MKEERYCEYCGTVLRSKRITKRFCNDHCRYQNHSQKQQEADFAYPNGNATTTRQELNYHEPDHDPEEVTDPKNINSSKHRSATTNTYNYVKSSFLVKLERKIETSPSLSTDKWQILDRVYVVWVTTRLKTLLECTLKLSFRRVPYQAVEILAENYNKLTESFYFRYLPYNYTWRDYIKQLAEKMTTLTATLPHGKKVLFTLSEAKRMEIISVLHAIGDTIPSVKLGKLGLDL